MVTEANLEHMEGLELNVLALISEQIHHHLQIRFICDVPGHDVKIRAIQENFPEELQRLSLRHVVR